MSRKFGNVFKVSVGISALNEENTIGNVIDSILSQRRDKWVLNEILIYSDGSTDNTVSEAKKRNRKIIKVENFAERKGKTFRLNQMLKNFRGDVLVIFDADIKIADGDVITNLVDGFRKGKNIMLVGGNSRVYPPTTFFEKAIYTSYYVYYKSREEIRGGDSVFACSGACIAVRKEFAKSIKIPNEIINEDTYLYFSCLKTGYEFKFAPKATVYFRLAANLSDFTRQMFRSQPEAIKLMYRRYFGDLIDEEYSRPRLFYVKSIFEIFLKNPLGTMYMIALKVVSIPFYHHYSKNYKLSWYTAKSTKTLGSLL